MKVTMYELLGMIKDGKAPKKIKYENREYYLYDNKSYLSTDKTRIFDKIYFTDLNIEVEIIEEPKGIPEKIDCWYNYNGTDDKELTKIMLDELKDKYNEIIDYLKSKGE